MREYELVYIVQPDLDEAALTSVIERVDELVKNNNGEVVKTEHWGNRKLAYPIRKLTDGYYVYMEIKLDPESNAELKRNLKYVEQVMRYIVKRSD